MDIVLETNNERRQLALRNVHHSGAETFECSAMITSGWLTLNRQFYFGRYYAEAFMASLKEMNEKFDGSAELRAEYEDQFIVVSCSKLGRVIVTGEFIEHSEIAQSVVFGFQTDQTVLPGLIRQFEVLLENRS
jgi:hypothetical protein